MSRSFRRAALPGAVVVALAALVAGCGDSGQAESEHVQPNYAAGQVGPIEVQNVTIVIDQSSQKALVTGTVLNTGGSDDALDGVIVGGQSANLYRLDTTDLGGGIQVGGDNATAAPALPLPAGSAVQLGGTGTAAATAVDNNLPLGSITPVTFQFGSAGELTLQALIEPNSGIFASYSAPASSPSSSASPTGTGTATATGTGTATATGTKTATSTSTATSTATGTGTTAPATTTTTTP